MDSIQKGTSLSRCQISKTPTSSYNTPSLLTPASIQRLTQTPVLKTVRDDLAERSATAQIIDNENFARTCYAESNLRVAKAALESYKIRKAQAIKVYEAAQQHYDFKAREDFDSPPRIRALEYVMSMARDMENSRRAMKQPKKVAKNAEVALGEVKKEAMRKEATIQRQIEIAEARVNLVLKNARAIHGYFEGLEEEAGVLEVIKKLKI